MDMTQAMKWLTVEQIAERMQASPRFVYQLVKSGQLKAARLGARGQIRVREDWIDRFLEESAAAAPREIV
jgi:excisionase family DNA binding protein